MKKRQFLVVASVLVALVLAATPAFGQATELRAVKVAQAPALDGQVEESWNSAPAVNIPTAGGVNASNTTVVLKAVYTDDSIYFLMQWADPTNSERRVPWQKQADGSWKKLTSSTTNQENTYYEDKAAFIWDINGMTGFAQNGCVVVCHAGEQPAGSGYGNKYAPDAGQLGDIWHWKSIRTGTVGQVDDQYLDATRYNAQTAVEAGRKSDARTGGGYANNQTQDGKMPAFTGPDQPAPPYFILDAQKQPFQDTFQANDELAGIVVAPHTGDRGDISSGQVYKDGKWTVEFGRKLQTGSQTDVQFADLAKAYPFGVATFDNVQVNHATSGLVNLRFVAAAAAQPTAPPAATTAPAATAAPAAPAATKAPAAPAATAAPVAPTTLPRTGDPGLFLLGVAGIGAALAGAGFALRRRMDR
ncbi:MAG: ethylbenzene dehydrogenase-related protein [Chloroflexota bacterium]